MGKGHWGMTVQTELSRRQPRTEALICYPISVSEPLIPCPSDVQPYPGVPGALAFGLKCQSTLYPYDGILDTNLPVKKGLFLALESACHKGKQREGDDEVPHKGH